MLLYVEDDEAVGRALYRGLTLHFREVVWARTTCDALSCIRLRGAGAIVTDWQFPRTAEVWRPAEAPGIVLEQHEILDTLKSDCPDEGAVMVEVAALLRIPCVVVSGALRPSWVGVPWLTKGNVTVQQIAEALMSQCYVGGATVDDFAIGSRR